MTACVNHRTDENIVRIRELRAAGKSYHTIAREMGIAHTTIHNICRVFNIPHPAHGPNRNADAWRARCHEERLKRVQKIIELAERGLSQGEICDEMGLTENTVRNVVHEFGIKCAPSAYRERGSMVRDPVLTQRESVAVYAGRRYEDEPSVKRGRPMVLRRPYSEPVGGMSSAAWAV